MFHQIDSPEATRRNNGLSIVSALSQNMCQTEFKDLISETLRTKLADHLLVRLHDEDLQVRIKSAKLFHLFDLNFVLPRLVQTLSNTNTKARSAASSVCTRFLITCLLFKAIISLFECADINLPDLLSSLADTLRSISDASRKESPSLPSDIPVYGTRHLETPSDITTHSLHSQRVLYYYFFISLFQRDNTVDCVLDLTDKWAHKVRQECWEPSVAILLKKFFGSPSDSVFVRIFKALAPFIVSALPYVIFLLIQD